MELTSGDPKTHPNIAEGARNNGRVLVEQRDQFVCAGGVNLITLLRITRVSLMEHVERELGANSVVDEQYVYFLVFVFFFFSCSIVFILPFLL